MYSFVLIGVRQGGKKGKKGKMYSSGGREDLKKFSKIFGCP
jgi:hypothetical protein